MNQKPMAAIYARLSEEDRNKTGVSADSESIINQVMLLKQYAENNGWTVYECYTDDDWAGADRNRPAFNQLLKDAEEGKFNIVLCKTQSRFTRELEMVEKYIHGLFPRWGIRFVGAVDNADTSIKGNKKSRQINGLVNEWYLEDMSENIKAVLTTRRQEGYYIGSTPLYGYKKDPERKGHLIIDPEAAEVVRLVFHSFANGMGKTAIARMLNGRGIPNPTEYKRQKGITYKTPRHKAGTLWKYFSISNMLANEMYIGNLVQGKYGSVSYKTKENKPVPKEKWIRVENTHEPIIDKELWETVQKMLQEKARPFSTGKTGLFARKVKCKHCGYTMSAGKGRGKRYLKCSTRHTARDACIGSFIFIDQLEQIVIGEIQKMNDRYLDLEQLENEIVLKHSLSEEMMKWGTMKRQAEQRIIQLERAIKALYLDKVKGEINMDQFKGLCRELVQDKERVKEQYDKSLQKILELQVRMETDRDKKKLVHEYVDVIKLNRAIVEQLIDYIEISKRDPVTKMLSVEIHWNF